MLYYTFTKDLLRKPVFCTKINVSPEVFRENKKFRLQNDRTMPLPKLVPTRNPNKHLHFRIT